VLTSRGISLNPRIAFGRIQVRRRQIRKTLRRPHSCLIDTVADAWSIARGDDQRVQLVDHVFVEQPTAAGRVRLTLLQGPLDLEIAVLRKGFRDVHDQEIGEQ
jgi:hypothetical protein